MTPRQILNTCIALEAKLDSVLFREREPDGDEGMAGKVAKTATAVGGGAYAGNAIARGIAPMVKDRLAGLRMTEPMASRGIGQHLRAVAGAVKDKPLDALKAVGNTVASDAKGAGSAIAGLFRKAKDVIHHSAIRKDVIAFAAKLQPAK